MLLAMLAVGHMVCSVAPEVLKVAFDMLYMMMLVLSHMLVDAIVSRQLAMPALDRTPCSNVRIGGRAMLEMSDIW